MSSELLQTYFAAAAAAADDDDDDDDDYYYLGPHWRRMCRSERRQRLREQYFFECQCSACTQDIEQELCFEV